MLFVIIALAIVATVFVIFKKKIDKSKTQDTCCAHQPVEEIIVPTTVEESKVEVETVSTVEVVPTTPPSAPTMVAKKKKPHHKKKPKSAKTNA